MVVTLKYAVHEYDGRSRPVFTPSPREVDHVSTLLSSISPTLYNALLYDPLRVKYDLGKFKSSIGSTNGTTS